MKIVKRIPAGRASFHIQIPHPTASRRLFGLMSHSGFDHLDPGIWRETPMLRVGVILSRVAFSTACVFLVPFYMWYKASSHILEKSVSFSSIMPL